MPSKSDSRDGARVGRVSLFFSIATLASRVLGFARTLAVAYCLGTGLVADAYNVSNQLPNTLFFLLGGGAVVSVITPMLISARHRSEEEAARLATSLLLVGAAVGGLLSLTLCLFASPLLGLLGGRSWQNSQTELAVSLSYWCLPQVVFLGIFALLTQIAVAQNQMIIGAVAPVVSSVTVIAVCIVIGASGVVDSADPSSISGLTLVALGLATLGGTALQATVVFVAIRRRGFRLKWSTNLRGLRLKTAARVGVVAVVASGGFQLANLASTVATTRAGAEAARSGLPGRGYSALYFAQVVTFAVQAILATGIATILLTVLSHALNRGEAERAAKAISESIERTLGLMLPVVTLLVPIAPQLGVLLLARGVVSETEAGYAGVVLAVASVGMVPYTLQILLLRPHYALTNTRAALQSSVVVTSLWIVGSCISLLLLPAQYVAVGCAAAFAVAYWADLPFAVRRLQRTGLWRLDRPLLVLAARGLAASAVGMGLGLLIGGWSSGSAWLTLLGAVVAVGCYVAATTRTALSMPNVLRWMLKA